MRAPRRPPLIAIAAALLGLIAVLATLQYRWLGRVSDAERERAAAMLTARAAAFARDFDRELTLAYTLFQFEAPDAPLARHADDAPAGRLAARHDRWRSSARHPQLVKDVYLARRTQDGDPRLERFDAAAAALAPADWPAPLTGIRDQIAEGSVTTTTTGALVVRMMASAVWPDVPALMVPNARLLLAAVSSGPDRQADLVRPDPALVFTVLVLDRDYIAEEMLPALARQHFQDMDDGLDYQLAVVAGDAGPVVYQSTAAFTPGPRTSADAAASMFALRPQEFPELSASMRRFTTLMASPAAGRAAAPRGDRTVFMPFAGAGSAGTADGWRLLVTHPSGSLEAAVSSARRRNLLISGGILAILAASLVLIVVSARQSQELARQQIEFVAGVSHELRTPLAVIRSAGDNLAEGVVHDQAQVRKYGALVRDEGRRLTGMVEQILEFSGIHSGGRALQVAPVALAGLIDSVLEACGASIRDAGIGVEVAIPPDLPPVAGDRAGLTRVFQNLVENAVKYGAGGRWIGITAQRAAAEVRVSIRDRGRGIAPADQPRIFDPFYRAADVVAAQIQGAGLGLSLVRRLVEAHGGRIAVTSAKGSGSEFVVHLPVASGSMAAAGPETGAVPSRPAAAG